MQYSKAVPAILMTFVLACGGGNDAQPASENSEVPATSAAQSAADLPDPCSLVTDDEVSELLWRDMEANQRQSLQAKNAKYEFTKRVEDVSNPAGRTCYFQYKLAAGGTQWAEGDFKLRTLARQTFQIFADSRFTKKPIPGTGDEAFYMSNAAYGRRGDVGVEVVEFGSTDVEIELLKKAVAKLP
jgi:hypothetical protein